MNIIYIRPLEHFNFSYNYQIADCQKICKNMNIVDLKIVKDKKSKLNNLNKLLNFLDKLEENSTIIVSTIGCLGDSYISIVKNLETIINSNIYIRTHLENLFINKNNYNDAIIKFQINFYISNVLKQIGKLDFTNKYF